MTSCLQRQSLLEKCNEIARALLTSFREDLVIRQIFQVPQIFFSKSDVSLSSCAPAHGRATLLRPEDPSGGRRGVSLMFFPTCFHAPNLPLHWCSVAGAVPHICLPHTPATFRVPLWPRQINTKPKATFLKSTFSQASLLHRNLAENFTPSHSLIFQLVGSYCL